MNWYVLIFEVLRQEATRYGKKQWEDSVVLSMGWEWTLGRKLIEVEDNFVEHNGLKDVNSYDGQ